MRFESKEQREELIKGFNQRAIELENSKKTDPKTNKNYNCKVIVDTRSEYDIIEKDNDGNITECTGDIYVFYIRQPDLVNAIKILEGGKPGEIFTKCLLAWGCMIDEKESSPEIQTDRIKLGYLLKMIDYIDALRGDQKKN